MTTIGTAYIELLADGSHLDASVSRESSPSRFHKAGAGIAGGIVKGFGAVWAGGAVLDLGKSAFSEAQESIKTGAQTNAVLKSTGGAANVTAGQVGKLATALSNKAGVDDEVIQQGQNMLLTFKNIRNEAGKGNDIFNQTSSTLVDMSAAMGEDPKQAAIQLGKALNDPTKGMSALSRVGVTFSKSQSDTIKKMQASGDIMGAQKVILKELNSEFGGSAAAQATSSDKLKVAFKNLEESVGLALMPVINKLADFLTNVVIPALSNSGKYVHQFTTFIQPAVTWVKNLLTSFNGSGEAGTKMAQLRTTISSVFNSIKSIITSVISIVQSLWKMFGATLISYARTAFTNLMQIIRGAFQIIQGIFKVVSSLLKGDWKGVWEGIKLILKGAWNIIQGVVKQGWNVIRTLFSLGATVLKKLWGALWSGIKALAGSAWSGIKSLVSGGIDAVVGFVKSLPGRIAGVARGAFDGIKDAFRSAIDWIIGGWNSLSFSIPSFDTHIPGIGKIGGMSIGTPNLPMLASGGTAIRGGMALVGEKGPELLSLPKGASVIPLGQGGRAGRPVSVSIGTIRETVDADLLLQRMAWSEARLG